MTTADQPPLTPHGQRVRAEYLGGFGGKSTEEERGTARVSGILTRFKPTVRACADVQAMGWIKAIYPEAIEYSGTKQHLEGMIVVAGCFGVMVGLPGLGMFVWTLSNVFGDVDYILVTLLMLLMIAFAAIFTYYMIAMPLRHVWRVPRDLPIIFDRKHRKVYRMVLDAQPGLKGLLKPWPIRCCEYEWDLLDAEHEAVMYATGASVSRLHKLKFLVRRSADDPTIIDHFEIGSSIASGESMVAPMYEHIRRFMQERGPHLPSPQEPLDSRERDRPTWWQACGRAGPFGDRYGWWWKNHPVMTLLVYHAMSLAGIALTGWGLTLAKFSSPVPLLGLMAPYIALSMNWGQGTGIWLMAHTAIDVRWPQAVLDAIGPATRRGSGWDNL